jgi:CheY-like chemotaxis protein
LLETVGFEVRDASNGQDALELWRTWRPDLMFMDQRMPVMDGSEATRRIRRAEADQRRPRTSIISLTASAFEHERDSILKNGADEFVVKPYSEETIFSVIARHLGVRFVYEGERAAPAGGNRVLLIDDDEITRIVAREVLTQLGLEVTEATDGTSALAMLDAAPFDVILLDVEMPGLDGRATIREIRSREALRDTPVIAVTSHDRADAEVEGMTDYISKPVNEGEVVRVLERYLKIIQYR